MDEWMIDDVWNAALRGSVDIPRYQDELHICSASGWLYAGVRNKRQASSGVFKGQSGVDEDDEPRQQFEEIYHSISPLLFPIFPQYFILQVSKLLPTSID